jgi:hypothetical protein
MTKPDITIEPASFIGLYICPFWSDADDAEADRLMVAHVAGFAAALRMPSALMNMQWIVAESRRKAIFAHIDNGGALTSDPDNFTEVRIKLRHRTIDTTLDKVMDGTWHDVV